MDRYSYLKYTILLDKDILARLGHLHSLLHIHKKTQSRNGIGDCPGFRYCPGSETVHCQRLSTVRDCPRALNEAVIGGCPMGFKNKKPFVFYTLGETPMTSFHIWHMHV